MPKAKKAAPKKAAAKAKPRTRTRTAKAPAPTRWRRLRESDTWHFNPTCHQWPTKDGSFLEAEGRPGYGELCDTCKSRGAK